MRRLLEENGDDAATSLLLAARADRAPAASKARALAALGIEPSQAAKAQEIPARDIAVPRIPATLRPQRPEPRPARTGMGGVRKSAQTTPHMLFQSVLGPTGKPVGFFQKGRLGAALVAAVQVAVLGIVLAQPMQQPKASKGPADEPQQYPVLQLGPGIAAPAPRAEAKSHDEEPVRAAAPAPAPRPGPNAVPAPPKVAAEAEPPAAEAPRVPEATPPAVAMVESVGSPEVLPAKPEATSTIVRPFEYGTMSQPKRIGGRDPVYTREALEARVEGTALLQCEITAEGATKDCRLLKSLPHMDGELLAAARTWRFSPATQGGQPISVRYVSKVNLVLPK
ncbi:energy transducer TonB [Polyangium sp. y55x31]|uniref:energy transducer TonB n=1 Tax=Polyangium sp. y55x31 TaxID=3042688 RepID=UPI0024832491|nr:energy transducer TonB [Polyangium sp. y55x31]MDI1484293.1 energy transducer TonB [Polyangium sp. y55x31]